MYLTLLIAILITSSLSHTSLLDRTRSTSNVRDDHITQRRIKRMAQVLTGENNTPTTFSQLEDLLTKLLEEAKKTNSHKQSQAQSVSAGQDTRPDERKETPITTSYTVNKGESAWMSCVAPSKISTFLWLKNDSPVQRNSRYKMSFNSPQDKRAYSILQVPNAEYRDSDNYTCIISDNIEKKYLTLFFQLNVKGSTTSNAALQNKQDKENVLLYTVRHGEPAKMTCFAPSAISTFIWIKDGLPVQINSPDHEIKYDQLNTQSSSLSIYKAKKEDAGKYTCIVDDIGTQIFHTVRFDLTIIDIPTTQITRKDNNQQDLNDFTIDPTTLRPYGVNVGETARFFCSSPSLKSAFTWFKNSSTIQANSRYEISQKDNSSFLTIPRTQMSDSAIYSCIINDQKDNPFYRIHWNLTIKVPATSYFKRNEAGHFECDGTKNELSQKVWSKDRKPLPEDTKYVISEVLIESLAFGHAGTRVSTILTIFNLQKSDSGVFSCSFEDGVVNFPVIVQDPEVKFIQSRTSKEAILECEFTLSFNPTIKWTKNGADLPSNSRYKLSQRRKIPESYIMATNLRRNVTVNTLNFYLTIQNLQNHDSGDYLCTTSNSPTHEYSRNFILRVD